MTKAERLCDAIVGQIESGTLRGGDRLPSEEQLAQLNRVSVGTVQKALAKLSSSGLLSREQGRGTFVTGSRIGPDEVAYLRFRDARGRDLPHFVAVRSIAAERRRGPWSTFLCGDGSGCVRIVRSISVDRRFDLHSEFWMRDADFARLDGADARALASNLRLLLGRRLALPTLRVDQMIRFEPLPRTIASRLEVDPASPGFVMDIRGHTLRDQPLFFQRVRSGPFADSLVILR